MVAAVITPDFGHIAEPDWAAMYPDPADAAVAADTWRIVTTDMRGMGTLSPANGPQIARYADARVMYARASMEIAVNGPVLKRSKGQLPQWSIWVSVLERANKACSQHEVALGLTPNARGKGTPTKRQTAKATAADAYLKRAPSGA